jgi:hypothetical protein
MVLYRPFIPLGIGKKLARLIPRLIATLPRLRARRVFEYMRITSRFNGRQDRPHAPRDLPTAPDLLLQVLSAQSRERRHGWTP